LQEPGPRALYHSFTIGTHVARVSPVAMTGRPDRRDGGQAGYPISRMSLDYQDDAMARLEAFPEVCAAIKRARDPGGVLSPGRYGIVLALAAGRRAGLGLERGVRGQHGAHGGQPGALPRVGAVQATHLVAAAPHPVGTRPSSDGPISTRPDSGGRYAAV